MNYIVTAAQNLDQELQNKETRSLIPTIMYLWLMEEFTFDRAPLNHKIPKINNSENQK